MRDIFFSFPLYENLLKGKILLIFLMPQLVNITNHFFFIIVRNLIMLLFWNEPSIQLKTKIIFTCMTLSFILISVFIDNEVRGTCSIHYCFNTIISSNNLDKFQWFHMFSWLKLNDAKETGFRVKMYYEQEKISIFWYGMQYSDFRIEIVEEIRQKMNSFLSCFP